jgi:hypothetical protein
VLRRHPDLGPFLFHNHINHLQPPLHQRASV